MNKGFKTRGTFEVSRGRVVFFFGSPKDRSRMVGFPIHQVVVDGKTIYDITVVDVFSTGRRGHCRTEAAKVSAEVYVPHIPTIQEKKADVISLLKQYPASYEADQAARMWESAHEW